jgi:hypothetical protein
MKKIRLIDAPDESIFDVGEVSKMAADSSSGVSALWLNVFDIHAIGEFNARVHAATEAAAMAARFIHELFGNCAKLERLSQGRAAFYSHGSWHAGEPWVGATSALRRAVQPL